MKNYSDTHNDNNAHQASGYFYRKGVIRWILRIFYVISAILFLIDFIIHRHTVTDIEKIPTFYALYGFFACAILIIIAKWIRIAVIRAENYYDEPEDSNDFLQKQGLELPESGYDNSITADKADSKINKEAS